MNGPKRGITNMLVMRNQERIPQLGFGTYRLAQAEAGPAVSYALECGYRHIDCAKAYCNEREVGQALEGFIKSRRVKREELFVTSKLWPTDQHPDFVEAACRETLSELRLDYLDLYLIHWPICWRHTPTFRTDEDKYPRNIDGRAAVDNSVTLCDTWRSLSSLVDKGLVKSIGLSNCNTKQVNEINALGDATAEVHGPVLNQVELHPAWIDSDLVTCHGTHGMLTAAYCPLGMPSRFTPSNYLPLTEHPIVLRVAKYCGFSPQRVLLNWNLDRNNVVVVKATKKEHIKANAQAARFALGHPPRFILSMLGESGDRIKVINPENMTDADGPFFPVPTPESLKEGGPQS